MLSGPSTSSLFLNFQIHTAHSEVLHSLVFEVYEIPLLMPHLTSIAVRLGTRLYPKVSGLSR
jgi:hypothetical protein